jgi:hypothetical protein
VVRRIFAAALDLQAALGLIGDHSGATKIYHAIDELHHAISDIRDTIFDRSPARHFRSCPRHAEAALPGFALAQQRKLSHEGIPATR